MLVEQLEYGSLGGAIAFSQIDAGSATLVSGDELSDFVRSQPAPNEVRLTGRRQSRLPFRGLVCAFQRFSQRGNLVIEVRVAM